MANVVFLVDQASYHASMRIRDFYKKNNLKVVLNAVANPEFAPIELCFNKWKNTVKSEYYGTLDEL